jgi:hypothetical protein
VNTQALPLGESAVGPVDKVPALGNPIARFGGWIGLVLWTLLLIYGAANSLTSDPHNGDWVGVVYVEGAASYFWFQDEESCVAAMAGESSDCFPSSALSDRQ